MKHRRRLLLLCAIARANRALLAAERRATQLFGLPGFPGAMSRAEERLQRLLRLRERAGILCRPVLRPALPPDDSHLDEAASARADTLLELEDRLAEMDVWP